MNHEEARAIMRRIALDYDRLAKLAEEQLADQERRLAIDTSTRVSGDQVVSIISARSGRLVFARPRKGACSCAARRLLPDLCFLRLFLLRPLKLKSTSMSQRSLVMNSCMTKFRWPPICTSGSSALRRLRRARCSRAG